MRMQICSGLACDEPLDLKISEVGKMYEHGLRQISEMTFSVHVCMYTSYIRSYL